MAQVKRFFKQAGYVLRRRPYSESSLLVEIFSREHGVQVLLAKGARRLKSSYRGLLHCFQPLLLSWSGRHELMTLTHAESINYRTRLPLQELVCASYANELLLRFLHRGDSHEQLFDAYENLLLHLHSGLDNEWALRLFEKYTLADIGYGLVLDHEVTNNNPINREGNYIYVPDRGPINNKSSSLSGLDISGRSLLDLDREELSESSSKLECKRLMQMCIAVHLDAKPLHSRNFFRQVARFSQQRNTTVPLQTS